MTLSVARAFQPEPIAVVLNVWAVDSRVAVPLTPNHSPPFHGGEGRILWSVVRRAATVGEREFGVGMGVGVLSRMPGCTSLPGCGFVNFVG